MEKSLYAFLFLILFLPVAGWAIGISPPLIDAGIVPEDGEEKHSLFLVRMPEEKGAFEINVVFRGSGAKYLQGPEKIELSAWQNKIEYEFDVIPKEVAVGEYQAFIDFSSQFSNNSAAQVRILSGATAEIKFTVENDGQVDYEINGLLLESDFVSWELENSGNMEARPKEVKLELLQESTGWSHETVFNEEALAGLLPGESVEMKSDLPVLEPGVYSVAISVLENGEVAKRVEEEKELAVESEPKAVVEKVEESEEAPAQGKSLPMDYRVLSLIFITIIAGLGIAYLLMMKKK